MGGRAAAKGGLCVDSRRSTRSTISGRRPRCRSSASAARPFVGGARGRAAGIARGAIRPRCGAGVRSIGASSPSGGGTPRPPVTTMPAPGTQAAPSLRWRCGAGRLNAVAAGSVVPARFVALIADPVHWREVVWVCPEHCQAELERRRDAAAQRAAKAKQAAWYDERTRALAAIELLPPAERARLHALAARGRRARSFRRARRCT